MESGSSGLDAGSQWPLTQTLEEHAGSIGPDAGSQGPLTRMLEEQLDMDVDNPGATWLD